MKRKKTTKTAKSPKSRPLISVIVPVYNTAAVLACCVDSITRQSYSQLEIILVDDGSTDTSGELCDTLAQTDTRIHVIHQPNQGLSAARNAAIAVAKGEYFTFVDSDDTIDHAMVERLYQACQQFNAQMSICSFTEYYPNGRKLDFLSLQKSVVREDKVFDPATCLEAMLLERGFTVSAWGKLYRRQLFQGVTFPAGMLYEDVGTTYKLVEKCSRIAFIASSLYNYYQNDTSITKQKFTKNKLNLITLTDTMCDVIDQQYSNLRQITAERRMHARFSVLRQIVFVKHPDLATQRIEKQVIRYLKSHKNDVLKNPYASLIDKIAILTLLISKSLFKFCWRTYTEMRH